VSRTFILSIVLAAAACSGSPASDDAGRAASPVAPDTAELPAVPEVPDLDIERVDDRRWVLDRDVLVQLAVDAAAGAIRFEKTAAGYRLAGAAATVQGLDLEPGDVITAVNDIPLASAEHARRAYAVARTSGDLRAAITRGDRQLERRYVFRDALDGPDPRARVRRRHIDREAAAYRELRELIAGAVTGQGDEFEVDRAILTALAGETRLLDESLSSSYGRNGLAVEGADSLLAPLGLTPYDLIKTVDARDAGSVRTLAGQLEVLAGGAGFALSIVRLDEPLILRYRLVDGRVDPAALEAAVAGAHALITASDAPPRSAGSAPPPSADWSKHVKVVDDTHYELTVAGLDATLLDPMRGGQARIVPSQKDGKPNGFKLYGIRRSSLYGSLGIRNGDLLQKVNGHPLTTPEEALEVYQQVKNAGIITVELLRRGQPVTLVYKIIR
jgi:type II secretory pathway component PulC